MAARALELLALPGIIIPNIDDDDDDEEEEEEDTDSGEDQESDESTSEDEDSDASMQDEQGCYEDDSMAHAEYSDSDLEAKETCETPASPSYMVLDLGVGSGLCASILDAAGIAWLGMDISSAMLAVAQRRLECNMAPSDDLTDALPFTEDASTGVSRVGDLLLADMGEGVPMRPGLLDGVISISALQWLCNADKTHHRPRSRLARLFTTLYAALRHGARAVFQFYPQDKAQIDMVLETALKCGFTGGLVIDYPNSTKRKKYFLCLIAGSSSGQALPQPKTDDTFGLAAHVPQVGVNDSDRRPSKRRRKGTTAGLGSSKDKQWVLRKKELYRRRGYEHIPEDSKYTARKRRPRF